MEADDGNGGIEQFLQYFPDLVVCDIIMPEKEGIETIIDLQNADEKSLLRIRIYFREQQWKKSISLLESFSGKYSDFLTAESFSLLSYAYFMKGDYQNAFINNAKSIELLLNMKSTEQLFLSNYNQSVYIARMRQINISNYYLEQASKFTSTLKDTLMVNRALATNYSNQLRSIKATAEPMALSCRLYK